jgi:hypothetical protein
MDAQHMIAEADDLYPSGYTVNNFKGCDTFGDISLSINSNDYIGQGDIAAGDNMTIGLVLGGGVCFDNVRLTATDVPEPSTLLLLAAGVLGLLLYARQRRRQTP